MWLLIAFIAVPMIEIALFIQVGGLIGVWWTLLIVLMTAVAGSWLVRNQGLAEITRLRQSFSDLRDPTEPLAHGAMILFAGALLLTPGFFTDIVGLSLLVPGVRQKAFGWAKTKVKVARFDAGPGHSAPHRDDGVIDADYTEVPPQPRQGPSNWTRD